MNRHDGPQLLSLQRLLERDRERNTPIPYKALRSEAQPGLGLLYRTIVRGSMVKSIHNARLRNPQKAELVFVGENAIEVEEIVPDANHGYHLRSLSTILIDDDQIQSSALLGHFPWSRTSHNGLTTAADFLPFMASPSAASQHEPYPLQMIVVALSSGNLRLYALDYNSPDDKVRFQSKTIPLFPMVSHAAAARTSIAVDPYSRAFVVASAFDSFTVYNNCTAKSLKNRLDSDREAWNPILQEKMFKVPGCITGVEFLSPGTDNVNKVVLIVVVSSGRRSSLWAFEWEHERGVQDYHSIFQSGPVLLNPGSPCDLIIPLAQSPDFLVVQGSSINLYRDILGTSPRILSVVSIESHSDSEPIYPGFSSRQPRFVAWARAERDAGFKSEFIYLFREDGAIHHYFNGPDQSVGMIGNAGTFDCMVGTAVTSFSPTTTDTDYLVAAGDLSCGQLLSVGRDTPTSKEPATREHAMLLIPRATLRDWASISDLNVTQQSVGSPCKITINSGRQPFGALAELRVGYEAKCTSIADLSDGDPTLVGATKMWQCPDRRNKCIHYIASYPATTLGFCLQEDGTLVSSPLDIDQEVSTVFAALGQGGNIVLVNSREIVLHENASAHKGSVCTRLELRGSPVAADLCGHELVVALHDGGDTVLQAFTCAKHITPYSISLSLTGEVTVIRTCAWRKSLLIFVATNDDFLSLYEVKQDNAGARRFHRLASKRIICSMLADDSTQAAGVRIIESIDFLGKDESPTSSPDMIIICGLRNGYIVFLKLGCLPQGSEFDGTQEITFDECHLHSRQVGHGPVQLFSDTTAYAWEDVSPLSSPSTPRRQSHSWRIFAVCGDEVVAVEDDPWPTGNDSLRLTSVYLTDDSDSSFLQPHLCAFFGVPAWLAANHEVSIACLDDRNFRLATVLYKRRALPRRLPLTKVQQSLDPDEPPVISSGTPTKLMFSERLNSMIVAGVDFQLQARNGNNGFTWQGKRMNRGFIDVVNSNFNIGRTISDPSWNDEVTRLNFYPTERVEALCEWVFMTGGKHHHFLLVGTSIKVHRSRHIIEGRLTHRREGRLWFLLPKRKADGRVSLTIVNRKKIDSPVRGLAVLAGLDDGDSKIVVCSDKQLDVYELSENNSWKLCCGIAIPSPAVHVTTDFPTIIISTLRHSVLAYRFSRSLNQSGNITFRIDPFFSDQQSRRSLTHLTLDLASSTESQNSSTPTSTTSKVVLASDKAGRVVGLMVPDKHTYSNATKVAFELPIPQCVVKFGKGRLRKPWFRQESSSNMVTEDIIGATTDGTIYQFMILHDEARLLLSYMNRLARWYDEQCRLAERRVPMFSLAVGPGNDDDYDDSVSADLDPAVDVVANGHSTESHGIDGDRLARFLDVDGGDLIRKMLNFDLVEEQGFNTSDGMVLGVGRRSVSREKRNARREKFTTLARKAFIADPNFSSKQVCDGVDDAIDNFTPWLKRLLEPIW